MPTQNPARPTQTKGTFTNTLTNSPQTTPKPSSHRKQLRPSRNSSSATQPPAPQPSSPRRAEAPSAPSKPSPPQHNRKPGNSDRAPCNERAPH
ncbi:hypothetical protein AOQ84DRAFT_354975 [Glonium stellatum]|uniref:Uncharacterized protein n=1 Tax=Glonium stellatum TaxID=574774 RepID=A0A8E2EYX1_9PEZI|nr:hypothetical protein AOQ84DRAFT_354975 [Glonium stellatum]